MIAYVAKKEDGNQDLVAGHETWRDLQRDNSGNITEIPSVMSDCICRGKNVTYELL